MTPSGVSTPDALTRIQSAFNKAVPSAPFDYTFTDEIYNAKFRSEERVRTISGIFSALTTFISCCGMFALASFMAEQRTKEISIRKVLGASMVQLWRPISTEFVIHVILSCFIAVPLSYWLIEKWLQQYNYRTTIGCSVFGVTAAGAFLITLITVSFQAVRTTLRNPVDSLTTE